MTGDLTRRTLFGAAGGALALSSLAACSPRGGEGMGGPTSSPAPTAQRASGLEAAFDEAFTASGLAGCAVRVRLPNGALWLRTAGVADLDTEEPYRAGDFVRIASITKTFTATMRAKDVSHAIVRA